MSIPKIDAHQHFWLYNEEEYSWIGPDDYILKRNYLPSDLAHHLDNLGYSGSIAVQARQTLDETRWLLSLADQHKQIKAVVGWVDLISPNLENQLREFSQNPRMRGIRHVLQSEPDDFMLEPAFKDGIGQLKSFGLVYELLIYPKQLDNAAKLVEMFPNQVFVLDHIAKPNIRQHELSEWLAGIQKLGSLDNVCVKVSGLVTEADPVNWKPKDFQPYLEAVWNIFGENRIMLGSDWPVCLPVASYAEVICLEETFFTSKGARIIDMVSGGNAMHIYRL